MVGWMLLPIHDGEEAYLAVRARPRVGVATAVATF